jgi:hypothetical protein
MRIVQPSHVFPQATLIDGADLLQKDHRILAQAHTAAGNIDMCRESCFTCLTGDGSGNNRGRMPVSGIILNDQDRPCPSLLAAYHRAQIGIVDITAFYRHFIHSPYIFFSDIIFSTDRIS